MKNKIANTVQPLLTSDPSLAEDLATLLALADWNGLSPLEAGFLSGFLPAIAARLFNDNLNENAGVSQITLLGGAFVGKSTVVNFLAGERLAESGVGTRNGRLPLAVQIGGQHDVAGAASITAPLDDHQYRRVVATQSPMGCSSLVWDASEATTHGALGEGIKQLGALLATSDVVVLVVSVESYSDSVVLRLLEWCVHSNCLPVAVVTKTPSDNGSFVADDLRRIVGHRLPGLLLPVVMLPESDAINLAAGIVGQGPLAAARQELALEVSGVVAESRKKSKQSRQVAIVNVLSRFLNDQWQWTTPIGAFNALLETAVSKGRLEAEASLISGAKARLSSAGFSLAGKNLLESLELPGHGRVWSLLFRLAGWPLRQWLVGSGKSAPIEEVESVLPRALGTWKARVQLEVVPLRNDLLMQGAMWIGGVRRMVESRQLLDGIQAKAAEIDANLVKEANLSAVDLLNARPGLLGFLRSIIFIFQCACLFAAIWYGSGGLLSLVYLAVFAGLADLLLVLTVRLPLFLIERSSQIRWLDRMRFEIINPFALELTREMKIALGPVNDAFEAWKRAQRTINNYSVPGDSRS